MFLNLKRTAAPKALLPRVAALCFILELGLGAAEPAALTRLGQCSDLMKSGYRHTVPVQLSADVYGVDRLNHGLALKDDSGFLWLETADVPESLKAGARISVSGLIALGNDRAVLGPAPVVEILDSRGRYQRTGNVYLRAGKHPFELLYIQRVARAFLEVTWEGPGFTSTDIPAGVLWHADTTQPGQWLPGMHYDFHTGEWDGIPDLAPLPPETSGIITEFTARANPTGVGRRFALRFTGSLEVAREGQYRFSLCADDSAALFLRNGVTNGIEVVGSATLADPAPVVPGQPWGDLREPAWMEAEGTVTQVGSDTNRTQLELSTEQGRMLAEIGAGDPGHTAVTLGTRVRLRGLARSAMTPDGRRIAGLMRVPDPAGLTIIQDAAGDEKQNDTKRFTSIQEIRRLPFAEAERQYPVQFTGVVTYVNSDGLEGCVQDEHEGIFAIAVGLDQPFRVGDLCSFEGTTTNHNLEPAIRIDRCRVIQSGQLPEALHPDWNQLRYGNLQNQRVELQGVVLGDREHELDIGLRGGDIAAPIQRSDKEYLKQYLNAEVIIRGTLGARYRHQQFEDLILHVNSILDITVIKPGKSPFKSAPTRRVADLLVFDPTPKPAHFVKIAGQIVYARSPVFYLMDDTNGLRFTTQQATELAAGDVVEVVGLAEHDGTELTFRQAQARKLGQEPLPPPQPLSLAVSSYESTLVRVAGILLSTNAGREDQFLELNDGIRTYRARLGRGHGTPPEVPVGAHIEVTGVFARQGLEAGTGDITPYPELLVNSPADIVVLDRPSWWTLRRTLWVLAAMGLLLGAAFAWIAALRRRVEQRTRELRREITGHHETEASLQEQTLRLQAEVEERKRMQQEVEHIHQQLMEASRRSGQAEVASNVLHNVGNVLNSVNVSAGLLGKRLRQMRLTALNKVAHLMQEHADDPARFLAQDDKGRQLPRYLDELARHLGKEQEGLLEELKGLANNIEHIKEIVAMQQTYARVSGVMEEVPLSEPLENAIKMNADSFARHRVEVRREYEAVPNANVDKHRLMQILVNLLRNATLACEEKGQPDRQIILRIRRTDSGNASIEVEDNGVGIPAENLTRIFSHGFTTRKNGHGFGLHSAALAATEMGGHLTVESDGPGCGARFVLDLPLQADTQAEQNADADRLVLAN